MALRLRRGTDTERQLITPLEGELIYTTDTKRLHVGDGYTAGGVTMSASLIGDTSPTLASDMDLNNQTIGGSGNIDITGNITIDGDLSVSNNTTVSTCNINHLIMPVNSIIQLEGEIASNLTPQASEIYSLGSDTLQWGVGFIKNINSISVLSDVIKVQNAIVNSANTVLLDVAESAVIVESVNSNSVTTTNINSTQISTDSINTSDCTTLSLISENLTSNEISATTASLSSLTSNIISCTSLIADEISSQNIISTVKGNIVDDLDNIIVDYINKNINVSNATITGELLFSNEIQNFNSGFKVAIYDLQDNLMIDHYNNIGTFNQLIVNSNLISDGLILGDIKGNVIGDDSSIIIDVMSGDAVFNNLTITGTLNYSLGITSDVIGEDSTAIIDSTTGNIVANDLTINGTVNGILSGGGA